MIVVSVFSALATGMFHDLILWSMLTFTFVSKELKMNNGLKFVIALLSIFIAITIQSVKLEYRATVYSGFKGNKVALFIGLAIDNWSSGRIVNPSADEDVNVRLNQGWIISAVMKNVPQFEPFANGTTIIKGIEAALLPRFLAPNKKKAGGQENFEKYTGLKLAKHTSMGISLAGEGYANFGRLGGVLFMFIWGVFLSWFWYKLYSLSNIYPTLLIWSPMLFLQVIKAETEFVVLFNYLVKSTIVIYTLLWFIRKQWSIKL